MNNSLINIFPSCSPPPEGQTFDQHKADEQLDMTVIKLIRNEILPFSNALPKNFIDRLMRILNRGSIHSAADGSFDGMYVHVILILSLIEVIMMINEI